MNDQQTRAILALAKAVSTIEDVLRNDKGLNISDIHRKRMREMMERASSEVRKLWEEET